MTMNYSVALALIIAVLLGSTISLPAQDRETKVRNDRTVVEGEGYWIYNDLKKGFDEAAKLNKPLFVVIRCIPCEACAQLDHEVVSRDAAVNDLLDQFVCVRIVQANNLDLSLFQYDYDQSFAAFFLNADRTIYGRYGTRSHETESKHDVSVAGLAKALAQALDLHKMFSTVKPSLAAKTGPKPVVAVPEMFPSLAGKYGPRLNYEGNVVQSCIHCHQVGEAMRLFYRQKRAKIPEPVLFPYPLPNVLGLVMDPHEKAAVLQVTAGSQAARDGFMSGDDITSLDGQPILSIADIQWVLHNAPDSGALSTNVLRNGKNLSLTLTLVLGWRRTGDISWRATSWDLRRMTLGGMRLEALSSEKRRRAGPADDAMALRVKYVGEHGDHALAKKAGFQMNDVVVAVDGKTNYQSESELMATLVNSKQPGDRVEVIVNRDGSRMTFVLVMQ